VFSRVGFAIAQLIGQQERLTVFAQALAPVFADRVDGHGEKAKFHDCTPSVDQSII
jgi:hypothetical protein